MKSKITLAVLVFSLLIISACAKTAVAPVKEMPENPKEPDTVVDTAIVEDKEEASKEMSPEVKELLGIAAKKVKSLRYSYKGPETKDFFYTFFVKEAKVKYILNPTYKAIDLDDEAYDTIYLDKELKTAQAYCDNRKCKVKGKKADLDYDEAYIWTPLEWIGGIEFAEKVGEELIESRNTWKLSINDFIVWVDTYFGVPLQVEFLDNLYKFQNMVFNDVEDEDVIPKG